MKTVGHGYTWNDLEVGLEFRTLNRTITESDLVGFINTTGMLEMIFIDGTSSTRAASRAAASCRRRCPIA